MSSNSVKHKSAFAEWSSKFKELKKHPSKDRIQDVIEAYQEQAPTKALRQQWEHESGYRKISKDGKLRGEQKIEHFLFGGAGGANIVYVHKNKDFIELRVSEHNFPLAAFRKGQVISDAFAFHVDGSGYRPVALEVKQTDGTPWYAVVENLIQVRLARSNLLRVEAHGNARLKQDGDAQEIIDLGPRLPQRMRGAWGLIIAPPAYYEKADYALTLDLIQELKTRTEARIMLATFENDRIHWQGGYSQPF